jgi:hypothetical protein
MYNRRGEVLPGFPTSALRFMCALGGPPLAAPVAADIDGDGKAEILLTLLGEPRISVIDCTKTYDYPAISKSRKPLSLSAATIAEVRPSVWRYFVVTEAGEVLKWDFGWTSVGGKKWLEYGANGNRTESIW